MRDGKMEKKLKTASLCLALLLGTTNTAALGAQGGSIGQGNFSVLQDEKMVDKLSGMNPLQEESMMVCDGKCMVKSEGISLTASDKAKFAIKNEKDTFRLFLRSGSIDYVITNKARKIAFHTPEGVYSVAEIVFSAASNPVVRGTVMVNSKGKTEITVKEGRMTFATADGMKTIGASEKIVLAVVPPAAGVAAGVAAGGAAAGTGAGISAGALTAAGIASAAVAGAVIVANNDSPSQVTPAGNSTPAPSGNPTATSPAPAPSGNPTATSPAPSGNPTATDDPPCGQPGSSCQPIDPTCGQPGLPCPPPDPTCPPPVPVPSPCA
jgi:hypothetical protein